MIFTSALVAVASLIGSASAQCSPFGTVVNTVRPGLYNFSSAVVYTDNVLNFKLNYPPTTTATITPYVNDSRVVAFPKVLTFSAANFSTPQAVELVLADVGTLTPPYNLNIGFIGRSGNYSSSCVTSQLASLATSIVHRGSGSSSSASTTSTTPASVGCNAFVTLANPVAPAPQAYIQAGTVTYADNVIYPRLAGIPGSTTTLSFSTGDARILTNVTTLIFTASNWNTPQPIALTINRNTTLPGTLRTNLAFTVTSPQQTFSVPPHAYPLTFNVIQDPLGCYYPPGCWLW